MSTAVVVVEDDSELALGLSELADLVEAAGFEVPEDVEDVEEFLAMVESDVLAADLDEKLGQTIKKAWHKAKHAVHGYLQKRRKTKWIHKTAGKLAGAVHRYNQLHPQHASADTPPAELALSEDLDQGLNELANALEKAGFEVPEELDVEEFLEAVEQDVLTLTESELGENFRHGIKAAWRTVKAGIKNAP
jgi:hypothetical protein